MKKHFWLFKITLRNLPKGTAERKYAAYILEIWAGVDSDERSELITVLKFFEENGVGLVMPRVHAHTHTQKSNK